MFRWLLRWMMLGVVVCAVSVAGMRLIRYRDEIAFISNTGTAFHPDFTRIFSKVFRLDVVRQIIHPLQTGVGYIGVMHWSPNGDYIAITNCVSVCSLEIYEADTNRLYFSIPNVERGSGIWLSNTIITFYQNFYPTSQSLVSFNLLTREATTLFSSLNVPRFVSYHPTDSNFVYRVTSIQQNNEIETFYRYNVETSLSKSLLFPYSTLNRIIWTNNGQKIAFQTSSQTNPAIFDIETGQVDPISTECNIYDIKWSPNEQFIAYPCTLMPSISIRTMTGTLQQIGEIEIPLTHSGRNFDFSIDSMQLYVVGYDGIYNVSILTGTSSLLTNFLVTRSVDEDIYLETRPMPRY